MINFTDVNPTLFASDGQFFYGKLVFLSPGTTDPKQVFDKDGVVYASNVVTTDANGRMEIQVFLDGAYDVQFWKFVGTQFDIDDPTQWAFDREMRVLDPTKVTLEISGDAIVGTIDDLRGVDNAAEGATMTVMGYYAAGDMTTQYYYWNPNAADNDDGGSVICPEGRTGAGRWLMIPQRVVDVRAFGVKPSQQANTATVTGNMAGAFNFANRYNRDLWFPKVYSSAQYSQQVYSYYAFNGGSLQLLNNDLLIDNCVQFVNLVTSDTNIKVKDIKKNDRLSPNVSSYRFVINSDTYRTVWGEGALRFTARKKVVCDSEAYSSDDWSLYGVEVVLEYPDFGIQGLKGLSFTQCRFTFNGGSLYPPNATVGPGHSFTNCLFSDRMYSSSGSYPIWKLMLHESNGYKRIRLDSCIIASITEFRDPMNFLFACVANGMYDIDICGKHLMSTGESLEIDRPLGEYVIRNVGDSNFDWGGVLGSVVTFYSCRFSRSPYANGSTAIFNDCFFSDGNLPIKLNTSRFYNCDVREPIESTIFVAKGSTFRKNVATSGQSPELYDSLFEDDVTLQSDTLSAHVSNCRFAHGIKLIHLSDNGVLSLDGCRFIGNYFETNGIFVDPVSNLGSLQNYVYEGNTGSAKKTRLHLVKVIDDAMNALLSKDVSNTNGSGKVKVSIPFSYMPEIALFAVGNRKFSVCVKGTFFYRTNSYEASYSFTARSAFKVYGKKGNFTLDSVDYNTVMCAVVTDFVSSEMPQIKAVGESSVIGKIFVGYRDMLDTDFKHNQDWIVEVEDLGNV